MKCLGGHMECLGGTRLQIFLTLFTRATPGTSASYQYKNDSNLGIGFMLSLNDTRYKMVLLPFHVYNYTHIRRYSRRDMHSV